MSVALVFSILVAGCGGDDEGGDERTVTTQRPATETQSNTTTGDLPAPELTETAAEPKGETGPDASPEEQPGGAGDEEAIRVEARFTGSGGRISPPLVRVPPFIAIRVELRSKDGQTYELRGSGRTLRVDAAVESVSTQFAGLRPGRRLVLAGPSGRVIVEASAEPGP